MVRPRCNQRWKFIRCGLMSLSNALAGWIPSVIAAAPQNGSTKRRLRCGFQRFANSGTSQRLPPAHFSGGSRAVMPELKPKPICVSGMLLHLHRPVAAVPGHASADEFVVAPLGTVTRIGKLHPTRCTATADDFGWLPVTAANGVHRTTEEGRVPAYFRHGILASRSRWYCSPTASVTVRA